MGTTHGGYSLTIQDELDMASPNDVPQFTVNPDKTIALIGTGFCLEASSGAKSGDVVRVNHCTGGPSQQWNFLPSSHGRKTQVQIQLQGSDMCIDVNDKGSNKWSSLSGAPVELQKCENKVTESWTFEEPKSFPE